MKVKELIENAKKYGVDETTAVKCINVLIARGYFKVSR
jgi:hypothetical protein